MKQTAIGNRRFFVFAAFAVMLLVAGNEACKKDSSSPSSPGASNTPVTTHWLGTGHFDAGPTVYAHDFSIACTTSQAGNSIGGRWRWTITSSTLGSAVVGRTTRMWFTGQTASANVIALQETSLVAENWNGQGLTVQTYSGTLSAARDTMYLNNILPSPQIYPIMSATLVKQ